MARLGQNFLKWTLQRLQAQEALEYRRASSDPAKQIRNAQARLLWADQSGYEKLNRLILDSRTGPGHTGRWLLSGYTGCFLQLPRLVMVAERTKAGTLRATWQQMRCGNLTLEAGAASWINCYKLHQVLDRLAKSCNLKADMGCQK